MWAALYGPARAVGGTQEATGWRNQPSQTKVRRIREGYDAFGRGDLEAIRDQFSPDIVWHVGGNSPLSGEYKSIDAVFEFFGRVFTETGGTLKNEVHDILANETHAVVLLTQTAERNGRTLTADAIQVVVHRDDQDLITESWFIAEDQNAVDEFWA